MNLLTDQWIPVRPLQSGGPEKLTLKTLLCGDGKWEVSLPRDDMELAALQLLICLVQVMMTPDSAKELKQRIAKPLTEDFFENAISPYNDWFQLDHKEYPFMQRKGAKVETPMDKLMAGLTGATNCCFVNEPALALRLCGGCVSIALFNLASCSPSFGGGFKPGLRGPASPVTTLIQGRHLRDTVWLNILSKLSLNSVMPWHNVTREQKPTWMDEVKPREKIIAQSIGLARGLFWQPAYVEVLPAMDDGKCSCCGFQDDNLYSVFNKDKFFYEIDGKWPHPHTPVTSSKKKDEIEEKFVSFGISTAPSWTQLSRFVVQQEVNSNNAEGQQPAAVVRQVRDLYGQQAHRLHLLVGGYLNRGGQASVLGRRHEIFTLNHGWDKHPAVVNQIVSIGLGYKDALYKSLWVFTNGLKESKGSGGIKIKGLGEKLNIRDLAIQQFYRSSEWTIQNTLACINFERPSEELAVMQNSLKDSVKDIFEDSVRPYLQDPELIRTLSISRRTLHKHLRNLEPQRDGGPTNAKIPTA